MIFNQNIAASLIVIKKRRNIKCVADVEQFDIAVGRTKNVIGNCIVMIVISTGQGS